MMSQSMGGVGSPLAVFVQVLVWLVAVNNSFRRVHELGSCENVRSSSRRGLARLVKVVAVAGAAYYRVLGLCYMPTRCYYTTPPP